MSAIEKRNRLVIEALDDHRRGKLSAGAAIIAIEILVRPKPKPTPEIIAHARKLEPVANGVHRRLDALERAAKLVEKWRVKAQNNPTGLRADIFNHCASELQEALEGK